MVADTMASMPDLIPPPLPTPRHPPDSETRRWADAIRQAATDQTPLWIQGGGSKAFLTGPTPSAGQTLDTRSHSGIVSYEPTELVVTVKAGTPLVELEEVLTEQGQQLAFEPPRYAAGTTVGGMVACGLSGPSRASVGGLRDFVLGAHLLNGKGEHLEFGGQVMKNVAGYDLSRLLAGSMGSLGVLTQVSLKVLPKAPGEATLRFELSQADALDRLARWRGQPLPLNASCWVLDPDHASSGTLYLRLRGAVAAVEAACLSLTSQGSGERLDSHLTAPDWEACRDQHLPFFLNPPDTSAALWRLSVAPNTPVLNGPWPTLVEWHGGLRWVWAPVDAASLLRSWAQASGGHATLFRLPAQTTEAAERFTAPAGGLMAIHQRLKQAFDPAGIFNPGRWGFGI